MRSVVSRLARREQLNRLTATPKRLRIQCGYLKHLPDDYTGPRHTVTVRRLPPERGSCSDEDWYEREERPGPEQVSNATGPIDEIVVQVCHIEMKPTA